MKTIYMDGTFRVAPTLFYQLYTIHGRYKKQVIPLMYILLPDKKQSTYILMLNNIKKVSENNQLTFNPEKVQIDFEMAT